MKISIIGSGWLAQPLAHQLITGGHQLLLTTTRDKKLEPLRADGLDVMKYELGDQLSDPKMLFDNDFLIIAITNKDPKAYDVLIDQLSEHQCKHLIFISSTSVYQNNQQLHDECSQQLNLDSPLLAIEKAIQLHPSTSIIRFAGLVGPGRHPGKFSSHGRSLKNQDAPVNLIHLDDCIGIIQAVIDKVKTDNGIECTIFNGCADTHPTKLEYYTYVAKLLSLPPPHFEECQTGSYKIIGNQKIKSLLAYQFIYPDVMAMTY